MSTAAMSARQPTHDPHGPAGAFASVLNAVVGSAAGSLERKATDWTHKLNDLAGGDRLSGGLAKLADEGLDEVGDSGGAKQKAGAEGVRAGLHGKNPVTAAIKGAWQAGSPVVKAAIVAAIVSAVLLLLLSPPLLLVFLLAWLIIAAVHRARAAKK